MNDLLNKHCIPYSLDNTGNDWKLGSERMATLLDLVPSWQLFENKQLIERTYQFSNFQQTMQFVRDIEAIIHKEDHHPQMTLNYASCKLEYSTHSVKAITLNDFICAAKIDSAYSQLAPTAN